MREKKSELSVFKIYNPVYILKRGMKKSNYKSITDVIIRIAGEGGDGVISCGELLAQAAARTAYHVFTFVTYPAEMRGGYVSEEYHSRPRLYFGSAIQAR